MENFNGILICCTNLLDIFDTAAMRRFNWKVKFNPVLPEKRIPLYKKYFINKNSPLSDEHKKRISGIENLTPGHVKAVHQRLFFIPDNSVDHNSIIEELEKEASFMKLRAHKKTGFAV
jgi:SpoVK/Ycf46/Vps4 family AAA+-type ATPase